MCKDRHWERLESQSVDRVAFFPFGYPRNRANHLIMTTLETIFIIIDWIILGLFICYKRNWYVDEGEEQVLTCVFAIVFAPINFLLTFVKLYCIDSW